jgi:hypothetical protein
MPVTLRQRNLRLRSYTMQKSFRLFALVAVLSLVAAPSLHAERTGTNPHPQVVSVVSPSAWDTIVYTVRSYFGL